MKKVVMIVDKKWSDVPSDPVLDLKKGDVVDLHCHESIVQAGYAEYQVEPEAEVEVEPEADVEPEAEPVVTPATKDKDEAESK